MKLIRAYFQAILILSALVGRDMTLAIELGTDEVACQQTTFKEPLTFYGNNGDEFTLFDNSRWKVSAKNSYEYVPYRYRDVIICRSIKKMIIGDKALSVVRLDR